MTPVELKGSFFLDPVERRPRKPAWIKRELYRGADHDIATLWVDPEGRFVRFVGREPLGVYDLRLRGASRPLLRVSGAQLPELATAIRIVPHDVAVLGRVWWIEHEDPGDVSYDLRSLLVDTDNDGDVDDVQVMTEDQMWAAHPPATWNLRMHDWWP